MPAPTLSVLLPYYNEAGFVADTLRSLLAQERRPDQIVLVDNASTDGSEEICRRVIAEDGHPNALFLREERPGKVNALETGLARVEGEFVSLCDADIFYPPHYVALALALFHENPSAAAVMAQYVEKLPSVDAETLAGLRRNVFWSRILTSKCFAGGAGQTFRTDTLRKAGGFSTRLWNHVLLDHEVVNRVRKLGRSVYHRDLWVLHTDRRKDRGRVRWNLLDRVVYRYTPAFLGDWYFYRFLGPRLARRKMSHLNLRDQPWCLPRPEEKPPAKN